MKRCATHFCLLLMLVAFGGPSARGQGTGGELPEPISAARLTAYADILALSPQQRNALNDLHAVYREEFQKLREGPIESWKQSQRAGIPTRTYVMSRYDLRQRIAAMDDRFFDSLLPVMTDDQIARLSRVRQWRQRERFIDQPTRFDPPLFDLTAALQPLNLPSDQRQAIEPAVASWEAAATRAIQQLADANESTQRNLYEEFAKAGLTDEGLIDSANAKPIGDIYGRVAKESAAEHFKMVSEIFELNKRAVASLSPLLPPESFAAVRGTFLEAVYGMDSAWIRPSPFAAALTRENLTDDQRAILRQEAEKYDREIEVERSQSMARLDEYRARYGAAGMNIDRQRLSEDTTTLEEEGRKAWQRISQLFIDGRTRADAIVGVAAKPVDDLDSETADLARVSVTTLVSERGGVAVMLPPAISSRDIMQYALWLGLDQPHQRALTAVHAKYLERYSLFEAQHKPAISSASEPLAANPNGGGYTAENVRRVQDAQTAAETALRALDEGFFAEMAQALAVAPDNEGLLRSKLARQRQWCNRIPFSSDMFPPGRRWEGQIDLAALLGRMQRVGLDQPAVDRVLFEYEKAVAPLQAVKRDLNVAYRRADAQLRVEWEIRKAETGEKLPDISDRAKALGLDQMRDDFIKVTLQIADLNRATIHRVVKELPPEQALRLERTYLRIAWNRIFNDPGCATPLLAAALNLPDLTAQQRAEIESLAAEYHPAYDEFCRRMIESVEPSDSPVMLGRATGDDNVAFDKRRSARQRLAFDRHELSLRAWNRLKAILNEEQAKSIGMKPSPPDGPNKNDDFGN